MQSSAQVGIPILSASSKNQANNTVIFFQVTKLRGAFNKFPDFFGMDTFINRTHKKL